MSDFVISIDPLGRTGTIEVKYSTIDKKYTVTDITIDREKLLLLFLNNHAKLNTLRF